MVDEDVNHPEKLVDGDINHPEERRPRRSKTKEIICSRDFFSKGIKSKNGLTRTSTIRKNDVLVVQKQKRLFVPMNFSVKG